MRDWCLDSIIFSDASYGSRLCDSKRNRSLAQEPGGDGGDGLRRERDDHFNENLHPIPQADKSDF
jgi:hypothetical protein